MRFAAPADVSSVSLSCGEFAVKNGFVQVPEDIGQGDLAGLATNGFKPAHPEPEAKVEPKPEAKAEAKAKPAKAKK